MAINYSSDVAAVQGLQEQYIQFKNEVKKVVIGQEQVVEQLFISILCNAHTVLVGVPGLAKTLLVKTISSCLALDFNRIQFTPDLMPSDITGTEILDENRHFKFIPGPIFSNIILADEINRTPPKTQAALLEAMQEKATTVGGKNYALPQPYFVWATQNPIEQEGTYPLPEAQLDRFMFQVWVDYPSLEDEIAIVRQTTTNYQAHVQSVFTIEEILYYQDLVRKVPVNDNVIQYAVNLVRKTRPTDAGTFLSDQYIAWGAGPRASQNLILAAKCYAILKGKYTPDIEDVKAVALPILRHRISLNYKAQAAGYTIEKYIQEIL